MFEYFGEIKRLEHINLVGVMNMAPFGIEDEEILRLFKEITTTRDKLEKEFNIKLKAISGKFDNYCRISVL